MGYGAYVLPDGREAGYLITATCYEPGCDVKIDRGMSYLCGETPGDERGCGEYFCEAHLYLGTPVQTCTRCCDRWYRDHPEDE